MGWGVGAIIQLLMYPKQLIACTSDLHHLTQCPKHYEIWRFYFWVNFPLKNIPVDIYFRDMLELLFLYSFFCTSYFFRCYSLISYSKGLVIAGIADMMRPAEKLSDFQSTALAATGMAYLLHCILDGMELYF